MTGMPEEKTAGAAAARGGEFLPELARVWASLPARGPVLGLLGAWVALFQFLGNSTLGYVNTPSLYGWWWWVVSVGARDEAKAVHFSRLFSGDEAHAYFMPLVVAGLLWWRRQEIVALPKRVCWPALALLAGAILMHVLGYLIQQTRISMAAFFLGVYALTGLFWGFGWLRLALFPFSLFLFCVPLGTGGTELVTLPLRIMATKITGVACHAALGINVIQKGTQLLDAAGSYQYEVAAACSGIRSLTAILAFGVIYGYVIFKSSWRRLAMAAAAFPLAVIANVFRLTLIIVAAEAFGRKAGNFVHENSLFSLAPYVPSIGGMLLLGWWLREDRRPRQREEIPVVEAVAQEP